MASSLIYAARAFSPAHGIDRHGGLEFRADFIPRMLGGFVDFYALVPGFFSLTLARHFARPGL